MRRIRGAPDDSSECRRQAAKHQYLRTAPAGVSVDWEKRASSQPPRSCRSSFPTYDMSTSSTSHLAFVIASVSDRNGTYKYRCVAAYSHSACRGSQPLRAVKQCLASFRQPQNAEVVREELLGLDGKHGRDGEQPGTSSFPCPFSLALLAMSMDVDLTQDVTLRLVRNRPLNHSVRSADLGGVPLGCT